MNFDSVQKIAAAILYEGYILYPYRPTSIKNRQRWNFGTLYPRAYAEAQKPPEPFQLTAECLVKETDNTRLDLRVSFLQLIRKQESADEGATRLADPALGWDEGIERMSEHCGLSVSELASLPLETVMNIESDAASERELCAALQVELHIQAERLPEGTLKLHIEVRNATTLPGGFRAKREEALLRSLVSAHVLLGVHDGEFISLLEPEEEFRLAAASCHNTGVFPVLVGTEPDRSMMLCSPIILYDYPQVAPESSGDFFDGTEMDEMLLLRVLTLTDEEKEEVRQRDPRARRILERTEAMTPDTLLNTHGVIRGMREIRSGGGS